MQKFIRLTSVLAIQTSLTINASAPEQRDEENVMGAPSEYLALLRQIFPPPPSMERAIAGAPPIKFGAHVDEVLNAKNFDAGSRLMLLRIRLHTSTIKEFTYHANQAFGWTALECEVLWYDMHFS